MTKRGAPTRSRLAALALVLAAAWPTVAHADGDADLERLRKRFGEGISREEEDKWAEALTIFKEVAVEKMSPQVRFHIALSEEKLGRLATALAGYQEALEMALAAGDSAADVAENAPKKIAALDARVPRLTIRVQGGGTALLDDEEVDPDRLGAPLPLDPGRHRVAVRRGDTDEPVKALTLEPGAREVVNVPPPKPAVDTGPAPPPQPEVIHEDGTKIPAIIVGSAGLAALVGGAVMFGLRQVAIDDVASTCTNPDALTGCDPAKRDQAALGQTYEYAAIGLAAGGGALLGTAAILWFTVGQDRIVTKPLPPKSADAESVSIGVGPSGVVVRGRF